MFLFGFHGRLSTEIDKISKTVQVESASSTQTLNQNESISYTVWQKECDEGDADDWGKLIVI